MNNKKIEKEFKEFCSKFNGCPECILRDCNKKCIEAYKELKEELKEGK